MIEAVFTIDVFGDTMGFDIHGHAGYAHRGQDIICASVSSTTQMALFAIVKEYEKEIKYEFTDQRIMLYLRQYRKYGDVRVFMLNALRSYIEGVQKQYPSNISIQYEMSL